MKSEKRETMEKNWFAKPGKHHNIREKENYKYSGILEVDIIKAWWKKWVPQKKKKTSRKQASPMKNLTKEINIWVVPWVR